MSDVSGKMISVLLDGKLVGLVKTMTDKGMNMVVNRPIRMGSTLAFGLSLPGSLNMVTVNAIVVNASPKGVDVGFLENDRHTMASIMAMLDESEYKEDPSAVPQAMMEPEIEAEVEAEVEDVIDSAVETEMEPEAVAEVEPEVVEVAEPEAAPEVEQVAEEEDESLIELVSSYDYTEDLYRPPAKKKILIVEDSPQIMNIYKAKLEDDGYDVSSALSAEEGLAYLRDNPRPDLILLDLVMPGMDGFGMLKVIRSTPELKDIHVIILSSKGATAEIDRAMSLGIGGYLIKSNTSPAKLSAELTTFFAFR